MDGGSSVARIFSVIICIAVLTGYWFWESSQFVTDDALNFSQFSFLPISCSTYGDRAADTREDAYVYFWDGKIRIDLNVTTSGHTVRAHEVVPSSLSGYLWRDDLPTGDITNDTKSFPILSGVKAPSQWFCLPWMFFNPSVFQMPKNIDFQNQAG